MIALGLTAGCSADTVEGSTLSLTLAGLEALGDDYVYENRLVLDGTPVTAGRFTVDAEGMAPGLGLPELPELPDGWTYEGWVVGPDGPVSTGTFAGAEGADSGGAGPAAGPDVEPCGSSRPRRPVAPQGACGHGARSVLRPDGAHDAAGEDEAREEVAGGEARGDDDRGRAYPIRGVTSEAEEYGGHDH